MNPRTGPFCRRTRREFLWEAGAGFTGLALTGPALPRRFLRQGRGRRDGAQVRQPARPEAAAAAGQGQERHLPVHVRRPQPRRYLRLQAQALRPRRPDHPGQDLRPRRQEERGPRRRAEVEVQAVRPVRQVGQRPLPPPRHLRRRHRLPPLDDGRLADPRLGHVADEHGQDPVRQPVPRLVGQLRPGQRQREPARLRRDARPDRRPDQRRQELVERLHAGHLPGHRSSARPATPILDLDRPAGHDARPRSAASSTRSTSSTPPTSPRAPTTATCRPASPATSWPSHAAARPGGGRSEPGTARPSSSSTASTIRKRTTSAAAACWPGGWSSAACASSSSTPAAPTTTTTGTPTATWCTTTASTPAAPTSRSPACSRI